MQKFIIKEEKIGKEEREAVLEEWGIDDKFKQHRHKRTHSDSNILSKHLKEMKGQITRWYLGEEVSRKKGIKSSNALRSNSIRFENARMPVRLKRNWWERLWRQGEALYCVYVSVCLVFFGGEIGRYFSAGGSLERLDFYKSKIEIFLWFLVKTTPDGEANKKPH